MMKKRFCIVLILAMVLAVCGCRKQAEPDHEYDEMVSSAVELLKDHWMNEVYAEGIFDARAAKYLEIVNVRVIVIKDEPAVPEGCTMFNGVDYVIEFTLFDNYYGGDTYYYNSNSGNNHVIVYEDGSMEVSHDIFNMYKGRYFTANFGGIVEKIVDLGDAYDVVIEGNTMFDGMK